MLNWVTTMLTNTADEEFKNWGRRFGEVLETLY